MTKTKKTQVSVTELKRRLAVGVRFTAEFVGRINSRRIENGRLGSLKPDEERITERVVVRQGAEMASRLLTGPKTGQLIYIEWRGVQVREDGESLILSFGDSDFLKLTIPAKCVPEPPSAARSVAPWRR